MGNNPQIQVSTLTPNDCCGSETPTIQTLSVSVCVSCLAAMSPPAPSAKSLLPFRADRIANFFPLKSHDCGDTVC